MTQYHMKVKMHSLYPRATKQPNDRVIANKLTRMSSKQFIHPEKGETKRTGEVRENVKRIKTIVR